MFQDVKLWNKLSVKCMVKEVLKLSQTQDPVAYIATECKAEDKLKVRQHLWS